MNRRTVLALAKKLGATVVAQDHIGGSRDIEAEAPSGYVWSASETHAIVSNGPGDEPWPWKDMAERMGWRGDLP
jgi:hypothetical protein